MFTRQRQTSPNTKREVSTLVKPESRPSPIRIAQATLGNQGTLRRMEAGLRIGDMNDPAEREADRVADAVMKPLSPAPLVSTTSSGSALQRKCASCEEEEVSLQRKEALSGIAPTSAPAVVQQALNVPGRSLDRDTRSFMERSFGHDFGDVRVHVDGLAKQSARAVNARAYTVGSHIVFDSAQYSTATATGRRLLAHELTHVVQQRGRMVAGSSLSQEPVDSQGGRVKEVNTDAAGSATVSQLQPVRSELIQRQRAEPSAEQGTGKPRTAPRVSQAAAAVNLLRRLYDRYKANSNDKEIHDKYIVAILRFLEETVTDARMWKQFASLDVDEQRTARQHCEDALYHVKKLEVAFRTGYPPLDDERTWTSPIGAMDMAQRYLDQIINYREPIPIVPGWHKVVDENGVIIGYLYFSVGVTSVYDNDGRYVGGDEIGLERPLIDPIDIVAGGIGGVIRGSLRGVLSALARGAARAAPRMIVVGSLASQGLRSAVPVLVGDVAPSAFIMAETLAAESVPGAVRSASGAAARGAVSQGARVEAASVIETSTAHGATSVTTQGVTAAAAPALTVSSPVTHAVAGAAGATVASNVTAQQIDPRHARGYAGEQTMGFHHYSQEDGWEFIQGPSGSQGHVVTGSGFDGMAYNKKLDLLDLVDNKSLSRPGNVSSATAIDPARNLAQNLDDAIAQLTGMSNVSNRIRILELLRAKRAALVAGVPGPSQVRLVVTHEGGQTTGLSAPLQSRGVQSR